MLDMNKKKYTRKQIQEAINYWHRKLCEIEANELIETAIRKHSAKIIDESLRSDIADKVKSAVAADVKDEKDVQQFIKKNDAIVNKQKEPILHKAWNMLKRICSLGLKGLKFLAKHWKWVLLIVAIVVMIRLNVWSLVGKALLNSVESGVETVADGLAKITGEKYMNMGNKISDVAVQAGGYGGWSGAGLGGGLR